MRTWKSVIFVGCVCVFVWDLVFHEVDREIPSDLPMLVICCQFIKHMKQLFPVKV